MRGKKLKMRFLMLPNDLVLNCLARVSRLYYPVISLVCKRLRTLVASVELYQIRTLLGCTETRLYVCLEFPGDSSPSHWFTVSRRLMPMPDPSPRWFNPCFAPYRLLKNFTRKKEKKLLCQNEKKLDENCLVSVPTLGSPCVNWWGVRTVAYNIYQLGGYINNLPTSKVLFMDCRFHKWHEAPSMQIARGVPNVSVLDGKIYVVGGSNDCDSSNWMEFFDPKTQIWEHVQCPDAEIVKDYSVHSLVMDGQLYLLGRKNVVYKPKENRWDEVGSMEMSYFTVSRSSCVIDDIYYCLGSSDKLEWYDSEGRSWRVVTNLEELPKLPRSCFRLRLVNHGGNIAVLWENQMNAEEKEIWCVEISLERCSEEEIRGKIEWCNVVLTVPTRCEFLQFLSVTV